MGMRGLVKMATTSSGRGDQRDARASASSRSFLVISVLVAALASVMLIVSVVSEANAEDEQDATENAGTGQLEIEVLGLTGNLGLLTLALLDDAESFGNGSEPFREATVAVEAGSATVVFSDLPFGSYAAKVFQDENSNGELDSNFVGYPTEAFGFSNDAMGRFGPPTFDQAKFEFDSDLKRIRIHAR